MNSIASIVFGLIGFWIVSFLIDRSRKNKQLNNIQKPSTQANGAPPTLQEIQQACILLDLTFPLSTKQLEQARDKKLAEYAADKLNTSARELQEIAAAKRQEIDAAYQLLKNAW